MNFYSDRALFNDWISGVIYRFGNVVAICANFNSTYLRFINKVISKTFCCLRIYCLKFIAFIYCYPSCYPSCIWSIFSDVNFAIAVCVISKDVTIYTVNNFGSGEVSGLSVGCLTIRWTINCVTISILVVNCSSDVLVEVIVFVWLAFLIFSCGAVLKGYIVNFTVILIINCILLAITIFYKNITLFL